jgi:tellurite resistance protein TerC
MNETSSLLWLGLFVVAGVAVSIDLLIHRRRKGDSARAAWTESLAWIVLALLFDLWILQVRGRQASVEFLTAYVVEKSLSIDNIFLFFVIFQSFRVGPRAQHRVLYYGVVGALVLRGLFVFAGVALLRRFHPVTYLFGAILLMAALRMAVPFRKEAQRESTWIARLVERIVPVHSDSESGKFLVRQNGKWMATSLLLALLAVEIMDLIFAVDSVPAVLAISRDPFIAYSSNVFAILGLRAIYFVLAQVLRQIRFLHQGLAAVLLFVGGKMVASDYLSIGAGLSLAIIATIFGATLLISYLFPSPSKA